MSKIKKILALICIIGLIGGGVFLGTQLGKGSKRVITSDLIENRLEEVAELASVNYHYKNVAKLDETSTFHGFALPFTSKKILISYTGKIKVGVDLKELKTDVKEGKITIDLPDARILSHEIDEKSTEVFDEKTSLFNPIKVEDMTSLISDQKEKIENEVIEKGLINQANESAKKAVKSLLLMDEEILKDYEIIFK